jgi:hypothetical protein
LRVLADVDVFFEFYPPEKRRDESNNPLEPERGQKTGGET